MNQEQVQNLLEKMRKCPRMPTMKECIEAIKHPETAGEEVKEYLRLSPEFDQSLRSILQTTNQ